MERVLYDFEELSEDDLHRPPLAAQRALRCAGFLVSRAGWLSTPRDARHALALAGIRPVIDLAEVKYLVDRMPVKEVKLYPRCDDPAAHVVPTELLDALAHARPLPSAFWQALRPVDRHVLLMLCKNTRLLWRALDELARVTPHGDGVISTRAWYGLLARAELRLPSEIAARVFTREFMDGRALLLARASGVRAARRAGDLLDLRTGIGTGPIELGSHAGFSGHGATLIWQAHASTAQGEFFAAASLLAATTAAIALLDMLASELPNASQLALHDAGVREDRWLIGETDEVTLAR